MTRAAAFAIAISAALVAACGTADDGGKPATPADPAALAAPDGEAVAPKTPGGPMPEIPGPGTQPADTQL